MPCSCSLFFASWQCANWAWSTLLAASVLFVLGVLAHFLHRVFWACFRSLVALSGTWVPAGFSGIREKTLLLLCRLPLFGACSRRCGSCRPPALAFVAASALARLRLFLFAPPWRLLVVISYVMHTVHRLLYMCFLVPVLLHPAGFRGPILPWLSFSGRRCSGPVPRAAAVASFLPFMFFLRRRVSRFGSSCHGVASCLRTHVYCHQYLSIFPVLLPVRGKPFSTILHYSQLYFPHAGRHCLESSAAALASYLFCSPFFFLSVRVGLTQRSLNVCGRFAHSRQSRGVYLLSGLVC